MVRPENIRLQPFDSLQKNALKAIISSVELLGAFFRVEVTTISGTYFYILLASGLDNELKVGNEIFIFIPPDSIVFLQ